MPWGIERMASYIAERCIRSMALYTSLLAIIIAYINFKHYFDIYDSVLSRDRSLKFAELETLYQLEQKERPLNLEQEKAIRILNKQAENVIYGKVRSYFSLG